MLGNFNQIMENLTWYYDLPTQHKKIIKALKKRFKLKETIESKTTTLSGKVKPQEFEEAVEELEREFQEYVIWDKRAERLI